MSPTTPPVWLYLHFPHLQADQLSQQDDNAAVAVLDQHKRVIQVCQQAEAQGIQPGMPFTTALQLYPELQLQVQKPQYQQQLLIQLAETCYQYCAQIALAFEQGLLVEVASMWRLFTGRASHWQLLEQSLLEQKIRFHAAAGHTPVAAYTLAQAGIAMPLAATAELQQQLLQLPVAALPLTLRQQQKLTDVGIKQLGQMLAIPMADWKCRFNGEIALWLAQLTGDQPLAYQWFEPPACFTRHWHCLHEIQHTNGLLFPLQRILGELSQYLRQRQLATVSVELALEHREHPTTQVTLRLAQPEHLAGEFIQLARLRLQSLVLPEPVMVMIVKAAELVPQQQLPTDLFANTNSQALNAGQLISRLQSRLGQAQVLQLAACPDPRPENAYRLSAESAPEPTAARADHGARPCWLLPQPKPLPAAPWELKTAPERIVTGWWDNQPIQRDYFVAEDQQGQQCWVYRTPKNEWFIHGWFG
ncbi:DNA polymerase Y family protein [Neiella marina]|uniref:DNA polymerase Y family protein n=1 Tax=Neiella holothuriorum TaxID=2870530 RepID=A0ABS7EKL3_9GAMM|nr:DNA polymerase Y family protein [Neiella holothuriorum]MBW8192217.1 DNA polymerase Y family protein [Neiella holothuriorum]